MTHPLLHPPLQLIRKTPVCPACGLPVKWYDMGDDIVVHLCIDFKCPSNVEIDRQIKERADDTRAFYWCLMLMPVMLAAIPVILVLMVIVGFFERLESAIEAFKEDGDD